MKKIIAVDIDDVISNSTEALRVLVNDRLGVDLSPEDYKIKAKYGGYYDLVWEQNGLAGKISLKQLQAELCEDQSHMGLVKGAKEGIERLMNSYDVVLVTSRSDEMEEETNRWLHSHFDDRKPPVYFADYDRKHILTKGQLCEELGVSLLIDDNPEFCDTVIEEGISAVLFGDYGWQYDAPSDIPHCRNWQEIVAYVEGNV